ncbi:MAG: GHKL domain-containing protein [Alphaproteobacteria bacterium]|nr:GHKL domain-containing protein [Alphaproteobacteria bacterium]
MEWYQWISLFLTNTIRGLLGLYLVYKIQGFFKFDKRTCLYSAGVALVVTVCGQFPLLPYQVLGVEGALLLLWVYFAGKRKMGRGLFLVLFYEVGVYLWEFIASVGWAILMHNENCLLPEAPEYLPAVWFVRLGMTGLAVFISKGNFDAAKSFRLAKWIAIITLFAMIGILEQRIMVLDSEVVSMNMLWTILFMFAILIYNLTHQYEVEKKMAQLQTEQKELLKKDYQNLNSIYTANARLYHDLHNHLEIMRSCITQGKSDEALQYLDALQAPIQNITKTVWTGDEAIDYLLNSKLSLMKEENIVSKVNIEFPGNTNIRSADLTAVLGNLLDNAIEAVRKCEENRCISLTIRRINHMLIIKVENTYARTPVLKDGLPQTTKSDKTHHGWGLKSVRAAVEQYDGTLETSYAESVFRAVATMFYN